MKGKKKLRERLISYNSQIVWTMSLLGSIVSAAAIISLIQKIGDITISEFFLNLLEYYRSITRTFVDWIPFPYDFKIPQWYLDAFVVNSFFTSSYIRTKSLLSTKGKKIRVSYVRITVYTVLLVAIILPIKELIAIRRQLKKLKERERFHEAEFSGIDLSNVDFDTKDKYYTQRRWAEQIKEGWQNESKKIISESKLYFSNLLFIIITVILFFICNHNL